MREIELEDELTVVSRSGGNKNADLPRRSADLEFVEDPLVDSVANPLRKRFRDSSLQRGGVTTKGVEILNRVPSRGLAPLATRLLFVFSIKR